MTTTHEFWWHVAPQHNSIPDLNKLSEMAEYLIRAQRADEIPRMLEKPWSYGEEWQWCRSGA